MVLIISAELPNFRRPEESEHLGVRLRLGHPDLLDAGPAPLGDDARLPRRHHPVPLEPADERRPHVGKDEGGLAVRHLALLVERAVQEAVVEAGPRVVPHGEPVAADRVPVGVDPAGEVETLLGVVVKGEHGGGIVVVTAGRRRSFWKL